MHSHPSEANTNTTEHAPTKRESQSKPLNIPLIHEQKVQDKYLEIFSLSSIILYLQKQISIIDEPRQYIQNQYRKTCVLPGWVVCESMNFIVVLF